MFKYEKGIQFEKNKYLERIIDKAKVSIILEYSCLDIRTIIIFITKVSKYNTTNKFISAIY
jgi:hypothetical protein